MATDYTQFKTDIFTGINDSPVAPTSTEAGNAAHTLAQKNAAMDALNADFSNIENQLVSSGTPEVWDKTTVIYFDTTNGDDTNDGLTNTTPLQTWGAVLSLLATKAVNTIEIQQLDTTEFSITNFDLSGLTFIYKFEGNLDASAFEKLQNVIKFSNLVVKTNPTNQELLVNSDGKNKHIDYLFNNCTITFDNWHYIDPNPEYLFIDCTLNITANNAYCVFYYEYPDVELIVKAQNTTFDDLGNFAFNPFEVYAPSTSQLHWDICTFVGAWSLVHTFGGHMRQYFYGASDYTGLTASGYQLGFINEDYPKELITFGSRVEDLFPLDHWYGTAVKHKINGAYDSYNREPSAVENHIIFLGDITQQEYILYPFNDVSVKRLCNIIIAANSGDFTFDLLAGTTTIASGLNSGTFDFNNDIANLTTGDGVSYYKFTDDNLRISVTANNAALGITVQLNLTNNDS